MANHIHLVTTTSDADLSDGMREILSRYARYFNVRSGHSGHVFGEAYGATVIDTDAYLLMAVRYVNRNPVRAGIVTNVDDYPWCDYGADTSGGPVLKSVDRSTVLGLLHPHPQMGSTQFRELIVGSTAPARAAQPPPMVTNLEAAVGRRRAIEYATTAGYHSTEVAAALGVTVQTINAHLRRAATVGAPRPPSRPRTPTPSSEEAEAVKRRRLRIDSR